MIIREYRESDLSQILELHRLFQADSFNLPGIDDSYATSLVEHNGYILGFGMLRDITESILIMDLDLPLKVKIWVLSELIKESIRKSKSDFVHSFVQNENFEKVLKRHYGYRDCKGKALALEI